MAKCEALQPTCSPCSTWFKQIWWFPCGVFWACWQARITSGRQPLLAVVEQQQCGSLISPDSDSLQFPAHPHPCVDAKLSCLRPVLVTQQLVSGSRGSCGPEVQTNSHADSTATHQCSAVTHRAASLRLSMSCPTTTASLMAALAPTSFAGGEHQCCQVCRMATCSAMPAHTANPYQGWQWMGSLRH